METMNNMFVNEKKQCIRMVEGKPYERYAIQTHLIGKDDDIIEVVKKYAVPHMQKGDILFMSEKGVACSQNRAIPLSEIHPSPLAKFLVKFVYRSPHGLGRTKAETMQVSMDIAGTPRILFAAICGGIGKAIGVRGIFYKLAGAEVRAIDGPCANALPPLNECVTLGPENPEKTANEIAEAIGYDVAIIDANDLQVVILGFSGKKKMNAFLEEALRDNPLGQGNQCTPMGILRQAK